jgi:hypothetical protein
MESPLKNDKNSLKQNKMETTKTRKNLLGRTVTVTKEKRNTALDNAGSNRIVKNKTREVYNPRTGDTKTIEKVNRKTSARGEVVLDKSRDKKITNAQGGSTSKSRWVQKRTPMSGPLKNKASKVVTKEKETISNPDSEFMSMSNRSVKVRGKVRGQKAIKDKGNFSKKTYNVDAAYKSRYGAK